MSKAAPAQRGLAPQVTTLKISDKRTQAFWSGTKPFYFQPWLVKLYCSCGNGRAAKAHSAIRLWGWGLYPQTRGHL